MFLIIQDLRKPYLSLRADCRATLRERFQRTLATGSV